MVWLYAEPFHQSWPVQLRRRRRNARLTGLVLLPPEAFVSRGHRHHFVGFSLIPIFFGLRTFGFSAPGLLFVPPAIMAASWALSVRHAIAMAVTVLFACSVYSVLISKAVKS